MYCSNCGTKLTEGAKFCSACGTPVGQTAPGVETVPRTDWHTSLRYLDVIREAEVAHVYALAETEGGATTTGDDFVSLLTPVIPVKGMTKEVFRASEKYSFKLYDKLGMVSEMTESVDYPQPPGKVIAAVACALASERQSIQEVDQYDDGCLIKVRVPPGLTTGAKFMDVRVTRADRGARVDTTIESISAKWLRKSSQAAADELFRDVDRFLRLLG